MGGDLDFERLTPDLPDAVLLEPVGVHERPAHQVGEYRRRRPVGGGEQQRVVLAALDPLQRAQDAAARAGRLAGDQHVAQPVPDDRLGAPSQVGDDRHEATLIQRLPLDDHVVLVEVQDAVGAGVRQESLGALVELVQDRQVHRGSNVGGVARVQHLGDRIHPLRCEGQVAPCDGVRDPAQHGRRRDQDRRREGAQPRQVLGLGGVQVEVGERDRSRPDRLVQGVVGAQEQGDPMPPQPVRRQGAGEHGARPGVPLGRGDDEQATMPGGARRQPHRTARQVAGEVAAALTAQRQFLGLGPGERDGHQVVEPRHHGRLVHRRQVGQARIGGHVGEPPRMPPPEADLAA